MKKWNIFQLYKNTYGGRHWTQWNISRLIWKNETFLKFTKTLTSVAIAHNEALVHLSEKIKHFSTLQEHLSGHNQIYEIYAICLHMFSPFRQKNMTYFHLTKLLIEYTVVSYSGILMSVTSVTSYTFPHITPSTFLTEFYNCNILAKLF